MEADFPGDDVTPTHRTIAALLLALCLTACGPTETANNGADASSDAGDTDTAELSLCNPMSPECGGEGWQFESDVRCPETPPMPTTYCDAPRAACYYCEDPELAASESGHPFEIRACDPNTETWQVQELACSTE